MKTGYEIVVVVPADPVEFSSIERVSAVYQTIIDALVASDSGADISIRSPRWFRKRAPAPPGVAGKPAADTASPPSPAVSAAGPQIRDKTEEWDMRMPEFLARTK